MDSPENPKDSRKERRRRSRGPGGNRTHDLRIQGPLRAFSLLCDISQTRTLTWAFSIVAAHRVGLFRASRADHTRTGERLGRVTPVGDVAGGLAKRLLVLCNGVRLSDAQEGGDGDFHRPGQPSQF